MAKSSLNLQDSFLNQVRKENSEVRLLLLSGQELTGFVKGFDNFTVVLHSRGKNHLIYKHAIAQITARRKGPRENNASRESESKPAQKKNSGFNKIDVSNIQIEK